MGWPYHFVDLSDAGKIHRREALDRYAFYAQLSALSPIALTLAYRAAAWSIKLATSRGGGYSAVPSSPSLKSQRLSASGGWCARFRRLKWWLGEDLIATKTILGKRDQWVVGICYLGWLLMLCVLETGQDYLHFTKRLGIIAASQFPIQYLLALKSLNPFAFAFRSSHEHINRYHRVLGRVISILLYLHIGLYINFMVQHGTLSRRLKAPVVMSGVVSSILFNLLYLTALRPVRVYSYRLFFIVHLLVSFLTPVTLFRHAPPARIFLAESLLVFIADLISRKLDTVTGQAKLERIPGTNLVKITASLPSTKVNRFLLHPASHVYLNLPTAARKTLIGDPTSISHLLFEFLFNPFTVAAVNHEAGNLTIVARHRGGPMTAALARLAGGTKRLGPGNTSTATKEKIPLSIEGPYGVTTHFPRLSSGDFDRVLLVAGGVGATFTVPLYDSIVSENPNAKVEMVWALRRAGDATWAVAGAGSRGLLDNENVQIFLTGNALESGEDRATSSGTGAGDGDVELSFLYMDRRRGRPTSGHHRKRPDLKKIVDDVFKHGSEEKVAVLVCGPQEMAKELRAHVGGWVKRGRVVWWHNEGFGF
ncbi:hypothetical protein OQA88_9819 [Cercophora sp. LCS_1]